MQLYPTEAQEAQKLVMWLNMKGLKFTHIANESGLPPRVAMLAAKKKKQQGVARGVPDYMVVTPKGLLFIELKRTKNSKTSPEQKEWIDILNQIPGVEATISKGADAAIDFITQFLE